jgi:hypothetical protein
MLQWAVLSFRGMQSPWAWIFYVVLTVWLAAIPNLTWRSPPLPRACLSNVRVIMVTMCVPLVESLCQVVMEWIPALEYLLSGTHGACGHVPSCQTINTTTFGAPGIWEKSIRFWKLPGGVTRPGSIPSWGGRRAGQIGGGILPAHIYHKERKGNNMD